MGPHVYDSLRRSTSALARSAGLAAAAGFLTIALFGCAPAKQLDERPKFVAKFKTYVSMAPSNTELLYAIGAQDGLVGVCTQCDFPKEVSAKERVGNFETVNLEKLAALQPDGVFLVNGQEAMQAAIEKQKAFHTRVILLHNDAINDITSNVISMGALTGHSPKASDLKEEFDDEVERIKHICGKKGIEKPKVFFCVWPQPLVSIGNASYLDDAITKCGGTNISGNISGAYPRFSMEKLMVEDPDVIIMPAEADHQLATKAPWSSLKAVKKHRLYFLPHRESDRLSRPTLRTLDGLHWLAERIHPELVKELSINKMSK